MNQKQLSGKKVLVVLESQYIPDEIRGYQSGFEGHGAVVEFASRLWGQSTMEFYSTLQPGVQDAVETIQVSIDIEKVNLDDYSAVVFAANYCSVRLRWSEAEAINAENAAQIARDVPAVRFARRAMHDRRLVKAFPCHSLWLLTPSPEVIAGRRVICNKVVLADVVNAGAAYTPGPAGVPLDKQVVVDHDVLTSTSWHATQELVERVCESILRLAKPEPAGATPGPSSGNEGRRILVLLSEWGYWGEELVGPVLEFDRAGYSIHFCTPTGKRPNAIPVSMDPEYLDPPLNRPVTTPEMAALVREFDDPATPQGQRLEAPMPLRDWFPQRPYYSAPSFVRLLEVYNERRVEAERRIEHYDALLIVGGSGPLVDLANNERVHDLILGFLKAGKPIGAECYGVACLAFARDMNLRKSILWGKHVTGHCLEYDYKDGTGFVEARGRFLNFNMGPPPYPLEFILRDATGPDGQFHGNFGHPTSVIVDYPFITGRSTPDSVLTGQKMIEVLESGLRQWGW